MIDEALHVLSRIVVRFCSPERAHFIVTRLGALLPPHCDHASLMRASVCVRRRGTCFTRALALAARAPQADLVIGVAPRRDQPLFAHAWLELSGQPIDPLDVAGVEIARIGGGRPRREVTVPSRG
jgi:hypothetical protein